MVNALVISHKVGEVDIGQRVGDGYVNATAICKLHRKDWFDYWRLDTTQDFLAELSRQEGLPIRSDSKPGIPGLVHSVRGGREGVSGTWVHPDVAVNLAQWCSPVFAVLVSRWVREWLTKGQKPAPPPPNLVYAKRLSLAWKMQLTVPDGYWTVFDKCSNLLILVECDLCLPVERFDLLDGSVGSLYAKYRRGKPWAGERKTYEHRFPDKRGIREAAAYPLQELPHFERWLRSIYIPIHLPAYLESKYELPLPAKTLIYRALGPGWQLPPTN